MIRRLCWLALAFPMVATAEETPCEGAAVVAVLPEAAADAVPLNARVLVEITGEASCHEALELRLVEGGREVPTTRRAWDVPGGRTYALQPDEPLTEGVEHTVEILGTDGRAGHGELHRFRTGSTWAKPSAESPRVRLHAARYQETDSTDARYEIDLEVAPTHDVQPADRVLLTIERGDTAPDDEGAYAVAIRPDPEGWGTTVTLVQRAAVAGTVCVVARQQDVAGQWSEAGRDCIITEAGSPSSRPRARGCSAGSGSPSAALLLLWPLLAIRRRRS